MVENLASYCQDIFNSFLRGPPFIQECRCILQCTLTSNLIISIIYINIHRYICQIFCISIALYQRKHMLFELWGLAYFIAHNSLWLGTFCCKWLNFILLNSEAVFHGGVVPQFLYPSSFNSIWVPFLCYCGLCCYTYRIAGHFLMCQFHFLWIDPWT